MSAIQVDTTRLPLLLHDLRLPAIARLWPEFSERADKESWPAARFLSALAELEIAERGQRRIRRNLAEARLLPGKTLDNFDFAVVPMLSKARVMDAAGRMVERLRWIAPWRFVCERHPPPVSSEEMDGRLDAAAML